MQAHRRQSSLPGDGAFSDSNSLLCFGLRAISILMPVFVWLVQAAGALSINIGESWNCDCLVLIVLNGFVTFVFLDLFL